MEEHEKALISRQFIEVMLKVPVILCPGRIEAIETGIKEYFPDFIKNSFPFFITRSMAESLQTGTLYHITDFINLHFNLFLYGGDSASHRRSLSLPSGRYCLLRANSPG